MKKPLLFLDFDGVLHREPCFLDEHLFERREHVEQVLRDFPEVEIVISSTWRFKHDLAALRAFFAPDIGSRIIGVTPRAQDLPELAEVIGPSYHRQIEIEGWLRQNGRAYEEWVALDDKHWWFRPFNDRLVRCDGKTGFDAHTEIALRKKLAAKF